MTAHRRCFAAATLALLLLAPLVVSAQSSTTLAPGKLHKAIGKAPVNLYVVEGGAGLAIRVAFKGAGDALMTLYAPSGGEMLSVSASKSAELKAVLPRDELYFLSVVRSDGSQPYSLVLEVERPDPHLELMAFMVGYEWDALHKATNTDVHVTSCWIEPGLTKRNSSRFGDSETTIGRGGREYISSKLPDGSVQTRERTRRFEGGKVFSAFSDTPGETVQELDTMIDGDQDAQYFAYLCKSRQ